MHCYILFQTVIPWCTVKHLIFLIVFCPRCNALPFPYWNSHCWLQTICPIYDHFSIFSLRVFPLAFWPLNGMHSPMSICSMYYIDCFCSQPCPEQREYGFIPEKFNFCSVFGVDFNIKILGVNIILREVSTVSRGKTSTIKLNSSEITAINHILHIFLGFPFFYNRNLHFCCSLQEHRALDQGCEWGEDEAQYWTL